MSLRTLAAPVRRLSLRLAVAASPGTQIEGLQVRNLTTAAPIAERFERVREALELIQTVDSVRFMRIRHTLRWILIINGGRAAGSYWHDLTACALDADHLDGDPPTTVAATIVHEAMHARLDRLGIRYRPDTIDRIERLCYEAEVAFAQRLPDGQELIDEARRLMALTDYSSAQQDDAKTRSLRALGWPEWLLRWRVRLFRE